MSLKQRLDDDLKAAMRAGETLVRDTLRMTLSAAKNRRIEKRAELDEPELVAVIEKEFKKRLDAAGQFADAGRTELADKENAEAEILKAYLPEKLNEDETRGLVQRLIAELGLGSRKDMGKLMKALSADYKGKVDMKLVQGIVGELLD